jgi:hypothetical protein
LSKAQQKLRKFKPKKEGKIIMKLTPPKNVTFWIATIVGFLAIISAYVTKIPVVSGNEFLFLVAGFVLYFVGIVFKGI